MSNHFFCNFAKYWQGRYRSVTRWITRIAWFRERSYKYFQICGNVLGIITLLIIDVSGLIIMNDNHLYIKVGICEPPPFLLFDKLFKVISTLAHVTCCNLNPLGFKNQAEFSVVTVCFRSLFILKPMLLKNMFSTFAISVGCVTICPSFTSYCVS